MKAIIKKYSDKFSSLQWAIVLWLGGFVSLFIIAMFFRLLLKLAY